MAAATSPERVARKGKGPIGAEHPRIAPPAPLKHDKQAMVALAERLGLTPYPWQGVCYVYLTATVGTRWLYPEFAGVVARQQGKTTLLDPLIVQRLMDGHNVMHTAQNRDLPRETHDRIAGLMSEHFPKLIQPRRGITYASGNEAIRLVNGAQYRIVAPTRGGARGKPVDTLIIDEVREMEDDEFIAAAKPTVIASRKPQIIYLSNAGHARSAVLNALRSRAGSDPSLAYLEWSAPPDLAPDDVAGWVAANPSIGHNPDLLENLEREYRANVLGGTMHVWEQEHLCRWVVSKVALLVSPEDWAGLVMEPIRQTPNRPAMGVKMDPGGGRVSAVVAWPAADEKVNVDVVADVTGDPIDLERLGPDLAALAKELRVSSIAFDPVTDADLMRHMTREPKPITGRDYASATERFVRLVASRKLVVHDPASILAADLAYTTRRVMAAGTAIAVRAGTEGTNTAAEACIRAVWAAGIARPRLMIY